MNSSLGNKSETPSQKKKKKMIITLPQKSTTFVKLIRDHQGRRIEEAEFFKV